MGQGPTSEAFDAKTDLLDTFLKLEELDSDLFRLVEQNVLEIKISIIFISFYTYFSSSTHQLRGRRAHNRVYGGQVVGQALMAANLTVDEAFNVHSLHCYFIEPGKYYNSFGPFNFVFSRCGSSSRLPSNQD